MTAPERVLYFDCFSGLAGDMTLGALVDLGLDPQALRQALGSLPLEGWTLEVEERRKLGIRGVKVRIAIHGEEEREVPAGAEAFEPEGRHAGETPEHDHAHHHYHASDIVQILRGGALPAEVVERAVAAFDLIGRAEAKVHGLPLEEVHFHEVGAVDSILDIAGSAWGLWKLGVDTIESAPPPIGRGFIRCEHGRMPCPAPATLEILTGLPVADAGLDRELVTPTGAAFVKAWARRVGPFPAMTVERVGWGAGNADFPDRPNLLRLVLGRRGPPADSDCLVVEANVDDLSPEIAGFLMERLFEVGARDAWFVPLHMKKGRPGILVGALADPKDAAAVEGVLLTESSSIGLRRYPVSRVVLDRRSTRVETPWGSVAVKLAYRDGARVNVAPEFEDCARLARQKGVALKDVYQHAIAAFLAREDPA